jgi:hypothetical protein
MDKETAESQINPNMFEPENTKYLKDAISDLKRLRSNRHNTSRNRDNAISE